MSMAASAAYPLVDFGSGIGPEALTFSVRSAATGGTDRRKRWLDRLKKELLALATLPQGWDSHGGDPLNQKIGDLAFTVLQKLGPDFELPDFLPLADGGLLLEWESRSREVSLQFRAPELVSVLIEETGGQTIADDRDLSLSKFLVRHFDILVESLPAAQR